MKKAPRKEAPKDEEKVILLEDLAPRKDVKAGSHKLLFGQRRDLVSDDEASPKSKK